MWERPFPTGKKGKPLSIDISLFDGANRCETRLEFGIYSTTKLKSDSEKLADLADKTLADFPNVENFVLLWIERTTKANSDAELRRNGAAFTKAAAAVATAAVTHIQTTAIDLFTAEVNEPRVATIGLFEVQPLPPTDPNRPAHP